MTSHAEINDLAQLIASNDHNYELTYGGLHIVIADYNVEREHIEWCLGPENPKGTTDLEREIARRLLAMPEVARAMTVRWADVLHDKDGGA